MPDLVRVKDPATGVRRTVDKSHYERHKGGYQLLTDPAVDAFGVPLPATRDAVKDKAATSPAKSSASTQKEG